MKFEITTIEAVQYLEQRHIVKKDIEIIRFEFINQGSSFNDFRKIGNIVFNIPIINQHAYWTVNAHMGDSLALGSIKVISTVVQGAPVLTIHDCNGNNSITVAHNDSLNKCIIHSHVVEETACSEINVELPEAKLNKGQIYSISLYIDNRKIKVPEVLDDVRIWWETHKGCESIYIPSDTKHSMYSTWYSFHQNFTSDEILHEIKSAKKMGCKAVIVDDGWQTDDNRRGYAYCGDWEVCESKIPDMKKFVDSVHQLDMKFILWYSVPFAGYNSNKYDAFKGMYLYDIDRLNTSVLDPRFKKVRDFLVSLYKDAVVNWKLDGVKLDFIDAFKYGETIEFGNGRDYDNLYEAVDALMKDIYATLTQINPDIMIEFRQRYTGPMIRTYGNILRACDCPNSGLCNRGRVTDIRMLAGDTAVHSDMVMWHKDEVPSEVARQLTDILFSVPQISMKYDSLSEEHYEVLRFYQNFWMKYKDILIGKNSEFSVEGFGSNYSQLKTITPQTAIYAIYSGHTVIIGRHSNEIIIINATGNEGLIIEMSFSGISYIILNCRGQSVAAGYVCKTIDRYTVPSGGMIKFKD